MIMLGNKRDVASVNRQVSFEEGQVVADGFQCPFMESSALSNDNVEVAFQALIAQMEGGNRDSFESGTTWGK